MWRRNIGFRFCLFRDQKCPCSPIRCNSEPSWMNWIGKLEHACGHAVVAFSTITPFQSVLVFSVSFSLFFFFWLAFIVATIVFFGSGNSSNNNKMGAWHANRGYCSRYYLCTEIVVVAGDRNAMQPKWNAEMHARWNWFLLGRNQTSREWKRKK